VLILLYRFVIRREEAYLSAAFPTEYGAYRARVRRFI
jgi:protein-S-isoprenylcysteine O-methyltransferase Ste14